jgi:hypothetical protein
MMMTDKNTGSEVEKTLKNISNIGPTIGIVILFCAFGVLLVLDRWDALIWAWNKPPEELTGLNELGDFVGGILNPIFTLAGIFLLITTLAVNSKELALSRIEMENSRKAQDKLADQAVSDAKLQVNLKMYDELRSSVDALTEGFRNSMKSIDLNVTIEKYPSGINSPSYTIEDISVYGLSMHAYSRDVVLVYSTKLLDNVCDELNLLLERAAVLADLTGKVMSLFKDIQSSELVGDIWLESHVLLEQLDALLKKSVLRGVVVIIGESNVVVDPLVKRAEVSQGYIKFRPAYLALKLS